MVRPRWLLLLLLFVALVPAVTGLADTVDATDLAILQSKLGLADRTGDFDGDGIVTNADIAALQAHVGHVCPVSTNTQHSSWGRLKLHYR